MFKVKAKVAVDDAWSMTGSMASQSDDSENGILSLPTEILQTILSYLLLPTPVQLDGKCGKGLLSPTGRAVTQTCSFLRGQAIEFLTKNILWVHIICHTSRAYPRIRWLFESSEPSLDPFRDCLPQHLAGLHFEFGDLRTHSTEEFAYVLVPFNFRWIARMVGTLLGAAYDVQCLNIWHDPLYSRESECVIAQQVHSLVPILYHDLEVSVINSSLEQKIYNFYQDRDQDRTVTCAFPRADSLINVLCELDSHGLNAEATTLCMYYYYRRFILDRHNRRQLTFAETYSALGMGSLREWVGVNGTLTERSALQHPTNSTHIERVRRARTLHYLEFRACLGYYEDTGRYGWDFVVGNSEWISDWRRPELGHVGWDDERFENIFGLLDFELAQQHYTMSVFHKIRADITLQRVDHNLFPWDKQKHRHDLTLAFKRAYYAWSLDLENNMHKDLLTDLMVLMPTSHVEKILRSLLKEVKADCAPKEYHFGGDYELYYAWSRAGADMTGLVWYRRAQKFARQVDVAFDDRKGDELPRSYHPEMDWARRIGFLHTRELDPMDLFAEDVAAMIAAMSGNLAN